MRWPRSRRGPKSSGSTTDLLAWDEGLRGSGKRGLLNTNELTEPGLRHRRGVARRSPSNSIIGAGSPIPTALTGEAADLAPL